MTLDGKPFEGMALVLLAMQIISLRIELRGTKGEGLMGSFWTFLLSAIPFVLLGMQKIAELKTYIQVLGVLSAIVFLGSIVMRYTAMAFRTAVGLGVSIATYLLIDTRYDTAVWVLFAASLFSLMYALFVVGPAKSLAQFKRTVESGKNIEKNVMLIKKGQLDAIRKEKGELDELLRKQFADLMSKTLRTDEFNERYKKLMKDYDGRRQALLDRTNAIDVG